MLNSRGLTMSDASGAERAIIAVLLLASVILFWLRLRRVLGNIRRSRPTPDFALKPLGWRVGRLLAEVGLQAKVIAQRPLPGLAHAFVFWGFCVFALITANHFLTGLGFPILDSWFGSGYRIFAGYFGVLVAIGIAGLFIRRFFVRPPWLGELSIESGVIALLIFLLMVTYIGVFFFPGYEKPLRWAHTLTLLAFLPLIPHTKHLHLVLSPAAIFLSRGGF